MPAVTASSDGACFDLTWPRWQPPPGDGLVAVVAQGGAATLDWADALLARDDTGLYVWASHRGNRERHALTIRELPAVRAVALASGGTDPRQVSLALAVASWLRDRPGAYRESSAYRESGASRVTSCVPPAPPPAAVRIPHLVSVRRSGRLTDTVVWELAPAAAAHSWFDPSESSQQFVEAHLDGLLRLRAAARTGRLPATAAACRLSHLLNDRDLSSELVYQRLDLLRLLLKTG